MKKLFLIVSAVALVCSSMNAQTLVAYWSQNSNDLPSGGFGYTPASFPQAADLGVGTLTLGNFITLTGGDDGAYTTIQSFAGDSLNAQPDFPAGGSFSPQGGTENGNNGMYFDLNVSLTGLSDPILSWAQRGTGTGFSSRSVSWSINGTDFFDFEEDSGALGSSWTLASFDFSSVDALDGAASVIFRVTLDGATNASGNNRFDNITVTAVPEPGTVALVGLGLTVVLFGVRRRRS